MTPYEYGRLARARGCLRILCVATPTERAEWERGYDDMEGEIRAGVAAPEAGGVRCPSCADGWLQCTGTPSWQNRWTCNKCGTHVTR